MRGDPERTYRRLLTVLPRHLRDEAGEELLGTFHAAYARVAGRSLPRRAMFWAWMTLDLLVTSAAERRPTTRHLSRVATDVRFAVRRLRRTPGWAFVSTATLALGLAATLVTSVLVRDVLMRPLPFPDADRLVRILEVSENGRTWWPSVPNAYDWRERARVLDGVAIADIPRVVPVDTVAGPVRVPVTRAARGMFETLGVRPLAGRFFARDENQPGGPAAAIVTEGFWRRHLGGRPLGDSTISIGGQPFRVVGVLPSTFRFLGDAAAWTEPAEIWTPMDRDSDHGSRTTHGVHAVGRIRSGVTLDQARAEMNTLASRLKEEHREPTQADGVRLTPLHDVVVHSSREILRLLMWAAVVVLLVACLNLAAGILAQGLSRDRELSVRLALGASRWTIARHLVVEAATLAVPGSILALALATASLRIIKASAPGTLPRLDEIALDPQAVALAVGLSLLTAIAAGLIPAVALSRRALGNRLRTHATTSAPREQQRLWRVFVAAQVTLSVVLLAGAGLLVRSFFAALAVDVGYDSRNVLAVEVALPEQLYAGRSAPIAYYDRALERLRSTGGIRAVGLTSALPHNWSIFTGGTSRQADRDRFVMAATRLVDPGYFDAIGIPRLSADARALDGPGAIIDRRLADQLWANQSPIGDIVISSFASAPVTVAGIVGTVREWHQGDDETMGVVYVDFHRHLTRAQTMYFVVRVEGDAGGAAPRLRQVLAGIDSAVPVTIEPLQSHVAASLLARRLQLLLAAGFGIVALLVASSGVYAMVTFAVGRQLKEAAIRMALGARPAALGRQMLIRGVLPPAIGLIIGLALAMPAGHLMQAQLFKVRPADPLVLASATLAVFGVSVLACLLPARRATRVDPLAILRTE